MTLGKPKKDGDVPQVKPGRCAEDWANVPLNTPEEELERLDALRDLYGEMEFPVPAKREN